VTGTQREVKNSAFHHNHTMKNKIRIDRKSYVEITEKEFEKTTDEEEQNECLSLLDWGGDAVAFFRKEKRR